MRLEQKSNSKTLPHRPQNTPAKVGLGWSPLHSPGVASRLAAELAAAAAATERYESELERAGADL